VASPRLLVSPQKSMSEDQYDELSSGSATAHWFRQTSILRVSCKVTGSAFQLLNSNYLLSVYLCRD
jgi:hypothetical protein